MYARKKYYTVINQFKGAANSSLKVFIKRFGSFKGNKSAQHKRSEMLRLQNTNTYKSHEERLVEL